MSDHGRSHLVYAVAERCRERPEETLLASTNAIYDELTEQLSQLEAD